MKHLNGTLCLINHCHLDESIPFRAMSISIIDNLNFANSTHAFEKIF